MRGKHHSFLPHIFGLTCSYKFLLTENTYRNKMFLLDQPNTFRAVIFLLHSCLFTDACVKPAWALAKSKLVCKHSKSCSFSPCLSANPVCSPCWLLTHLLIHISKLHLLLMLSAVSGLLDQ